MMAKTIILLLFVSFNCQITMGLDSNKPDFAACEEEKYMPFWLNWDVHS